MILRSLAVLMLWLAGGGIADSYAADQPVDLELVIAVDASDSMDEGERRVQRSGYVAAFTAPEVVAAMLGGPFGRIAVIYVEWGDPGLVEVVTPWTVIASESSAGAFATRLAGARMSGFTKTAIGDALWFCRGLFADNGIAGTRRVIDLSGDGPSNLGRPVATMRDAVVAEGIVVNGLPIMMHLDSPRGPFNLDFDRRDLPRYFSECVIGGPGAFILPVYDLDGLGDAIRMKLRLEIAFADLPVGVIAAETGLLRAAMPSRACG